MAAPIFYTLIAEFQIKNRPENLSTQWSQRAQRKTNPKEEEVFYHPSPTTCHLLPVSSLQSLEPCLLPQIIYPVYRGSREHCDNRRRGGALCRGARGVAALGRRFPRRADAAVSPGSEHAQQRGDSFGPLLPSVLPHGVVVRRGPP